MEEKFIKKHWHEEDILFYIHFRNNIAIRQIEISENNKVYLSEDNSLVNGSMLYNQSLGELELNENDFISKEEFEKAWEI